MGVFRGENRAVLQRDGPPVVLRQAAGEGAEEPGDGAGGCGEES